MKQKIGKTGENAAMKTLFVLPDIHERPTGGNVYNRRMIDALRAFMAVDEIVWTGDPGPLARVLDAGAYRSLVVDSLLAGEVTPVRPGLEQWFLLAHYLRLFDPKHVHGVGAFDAGARLHAYDGFITTSAYAAGCLEKAGVDHTRIHVVYPGVDEAFRAGSAGSRAPGPCRLLTAASLIAGKGLLEGIDLLERLDDYAWTWTVAGDDRLDAAYAARFRERLRTSTIRDRVTLAGPVPPAEMPVLYRRHDVFVSFSLFETLGMAIREAMACGLPVAAYDVGGVSESFSHGGGVLARDEAAMIRGLRRLIRDAAHRKPFTGAAPDFPSWQEAARRFGRTIS